MAEKSPTSPGFYKWCYNRYRQENSAAAEGYYRTRTVHSSPTPIAKKKTRKRRLDFATGPDTNNHEKRKKKKKVLLQTKGSASNPIDIDSFDQILSDFSSELECDELQTPNTSISDASLQIKNLDSEVDDGKLPDLLPTPLKTRCELHDEELESCLLCGIERSVTGAEGGEKLAAVKTRCELHDEELGSCLLCGIEKSVSTWDGVEKHAAGVDALLKKEGLCRIPCKGDGHCLLTAWSVQCETDNETLISALEFEFHENFLFYEEFVTSGGLKNDLDRYLYRKNYHHEIADVIINALCNLSQRKARLYEYSEGQFLRKSEVKPRNSTQTYEPVVLIKIGEHYDACKKRPVSCLADTTSRHDRSSESEADEQFVTGQRIEAGNLYKNDPDIPIFSETKKSYKELHLIEMLKNKPPPSKYQCKKLPYLVDHNMTL